MEDNTQAVLDLIRSTVREHEPNAEIILYGSRARGDARPDSDWDVLVLVDKAKFMPGERGNIDYDLWMKGLDIGEEINTKEYTKEEWARAPRTIFKHYVQNEGIRL